ncbi:unnamed protein product, partial [Iphiclides podalirius]
MYKKFTFLYMTGKRNLQCAKKVATKCEARVTLDALGNIVSAYTEHNHPPPKYRRTPQGLYIKIRSSTGSAIIPDEIRFLPTTGGKTLIVYQGYTFSYMNRKRNLRCSRKLTNHCNARFTLDAEGNIVSGFAEHNHPPPTLHRTADGLDLKLASRLLTDVLHFLRTIDGKQIILYRNYTFSYMNTRRKLRCSRMFRGKCTARIILDADGSILLANAVHNHPPPTYHVTAEGVYIKVRN